MNDYYEKIKFVKQKICEYLENIFKVYDSQFILKLGDYNLLENDHNCIKTSTATGFIMEEFVVSKLEEYTKEHNNIDEIKIERLLDFGTQKKSYDCFVNYKNVYFMINVKIDKGANNAVAAINILHNDYVVTNPNQEKSFIVLKVPYRFVWSSTLNERVISVKPATTYALEEIDFSTGHKQDHRNWSSTFNSASGRLQVTKKFKQTHLLNEQDISYYKTKQFIINMFNGHI